MLLPWSSGSAMNNAKKTEDFLRYTEEKTHSPTVLPAVCVCFFLSLKTAIGQYCTISACLLTLSCFIAFQVGAGWIGKCEYCVFFLRRCLYASMIFIFISPWFTSTVCAWFSLCSDLFICVCPCVQCAGSVLRAALWDKRTNPWPLRLSGTSGTKSVTLQMPPSLQTHKVSSALGWIHAQKIAFNVLVRVWTYCYAHLYTCMCIHIHTHIITSRCHVLVA